MLAVMAAGKKGITVRFEDHEMDQLDRLAARYRVSSATVLRWSLQALSEYVDVQGGRITLPLDFSNVSEAGPVTYPTEAAATGKTKALKVAEAAPKARKSR